MKGLLIKDLELQKRNLKIYGVVFLMALFFLFTSENNSLFTVYYVTMMAGFMVLGTLSYDDFDHGMSYLMTLPVTRSTYVIEKYVLGFALGAAGWLLSAVISVAVSVRRYPDASRSEMLLGIAMALLMLAVLIALMLPIQLKFGSENGRIVLIGTVLGVAAVCYGSVFLLTKAGIQVQQIFADLEKLPMLQGVILLILIVALLVFISCRISIRILNKKEF